MTAMALEFDMAEHLASMTEMCRDFGVTPRTLRFYEEKELIAPQRDGQRRLFSRRDRARVTLILQGKRFGFSLEEIRQLLNLYDMGDQQRTQLRRSYDIGLDRLADMERQRDELDAAIADLKTQLDWGARELARLDAEHEAGKGS